MKLDPETSQRMRETDELRRMVQSEGWAIAKGMLLEQISVLDSVSSLPPDLSFDEIGKQAMFRAHAISLVKGWLELIEGRLEQGDQQHRVVVERHEEQVFRTYSTSA